MSSHLTSSFSAGTSPRLSPVTRSERTGRSLPDDQQMARVQVDPGRWRDFRALAKAKGRTVAGYLGHLVEKELKRARRAEHRRQATQVTDEVGQTWIPPWEE
jgi:hypothetical protein